MGALFLELVALPTLVLSCSEKLGCTVLENSCWLVTLILPLFSLSGSEAPGEPWR